MGININGTHVCDCGGTCSASHRDGKFVGWFCVECGTYTPVIAKPKQVPEWFFEGCPQHAIVRCQQCSHAYYKKEYGDE